MSRSPARPTRPREHRRDDPRWHRSCSTVRMTKDGLLIAMLAALPLAACEHGTDIEGTVVAPVEVQQLFTPDNPGQLFVVAELPTLAKATDSRAVFCMPAGAGPAHRDQRREARMCPGGQRRGSRPSRCRAPRPGSIAAARAPSSRRSTAMPRTASIRRRSSPRAPWTSRYRRPAAAAWTDTSPSRSRSRRNRPSTRPLRRDQRAAAAGARGRAGGSVSMNACTSCSMWSGRSASRSTLSRVCHSTRPS